MSSGFQWANVPGGGLVAFAAKEAFSWLLAGRHEAAREILLEELRNGEKRLPPEQIDEGVAIVYRYFRAAQEGSARLNLRLMAKAIAGQVQKQDLIADEFLSLADLIASLRRHEVLLLAEIHKGWNSSAIKKIESIDKPKALLEALEKELALAPAVFQDREAILASSAALVRTGLLVSLPSLPAHTATRNLEYKPTRNLDRLMELAPLEAAIRREG